MFGWGIVTTIAAILFGLVAIAALIFVLARYQRSASQARSLKKFHQYSTRSPEELDRDYKKAKDELSKHWGVIEVIHELPEFSLGAAGLPQQIDFEQAYKAVSDIHAAGNAPIAIILHTMGGYSFATDMIAKALNDHKGEKIAFVPYVSMSGGTIIALATKEIVMGLGARLGPIDPQYLGFSAGAWKSLVQKKDPNAMDDVSILHAYWVEQYAADAMDKARKRIDAVHGTDVAAKLMDEKMHHSEAIYAEEAKGMGIRISDRKCPKDVYTLVDCKLKLAANEREQFFRRALQLKSSQTVASSSPWRQFLGEIRPS